MKSLFSFFYTQDIHEKKVEAYFAMLNATFKLHTLNSSIVCHDTHVNHNYFQTKVRSPDTFIKIISERK